MVYGKYLELIIVPLYWKDKIIMKESFCRNLMFYFKFLCLLLNPLMFSLDNDVLFNTYVVALSKHQPISAGYSSVTKEAQQSS